MGEYFLIFAAGVAGSFHCAGMCGGFACVLGTDRRGGQLATVARHLLYNTGRVTTYAFMGALAGALAGALGGQATPAALETAQRTLSLAAATLMILMALQLFGLLQRPHRPWAGRLPGAVGFGGDALVVSLRTLLATPSRFAPLALGVLNGFLPCPLVYGFLAYAASRSLSDPAQGPLTASLIMVAFGLGTFPMMLFIGALAQWLRPLWRRWGVRVAGGFVLAFALVTLARSFVPLSGSGHMPLL